MYHKVKTAHKTQEQDDKAARRRAAPAGGPALKPAGDDAVVPFTVESLSARGRAVQLSAGLDALIKRHNYPEPVAALLSEAAVLTALLGSALKFNGKFIMQTQTDGPVNMLVCDYTSPETAGEPAALRGFARFDAEKLAALSAAQSQDQAHLLGNGTLAFTIDQGAAMQLYQGIVALENMNLEAAAQQYFAQSEQIPTKIRLAGAVLMHRSGEDGALRHERRGGGILVQYLPRNTAAEQAEAAAQKTDEEPQSAEDKWRETELLTATVRNSELTDPQLPVEQLLYRLFHQQGVRVFPPQMIADKCSCSREKLFDVLAGLPEEERRLSVEDGKIQAKCQFCSAVYEFSPDEFTAAAKTE